MPHFYLSFVRDSKFAGATIIAASDIETALRLSHQRGLNPGGEVAFFEVHPEDLAWPEYSLCIGRLATEDELLGSGKFQKGFP